MATSTEENLPVLRPTVGEIKVIISRHAAEFSQQTRSTWVEVGIRLTERCTIKLSEMKNSRNFKVQRRSGSLKHSCANL